MRGPTALLTACLLLLACGDDAEKPGRPADPYAAAVTILDREGPDAALDHLACVSDLDLRLRTANRLLLHVYWERKDLGGAVTLGRTALRAANEAASRLAPGDPDLARKVKERAKSIAYNLASFTWPGWAEKGIRIDRSQREVGRKAARMVLSLALDLGQGAGEMSKAYWILGAHLLADEEYEGALRSFEQSAAAARSAGDGAGAGMAEGYAGIVMILGRTDAKAGDRRFREAVRALRADGSEDAVFYADQLEEMHARFVRRRDAPPIRVPCGKLTLLVRSSRTARVFFLAEQLSRSKSGFEEEISLTTEERGGLDRLAGILSRSGKLPEFFLTAKGVSGALFRAARAGVVEPAEANELRGILERIAAGTRPFLAAREPLLDGIADLLDAKRLAKNREGTLTLWAVPAPKGRGFCRILGSNLVLGVAPGTDPHPDLERALDQALRSLK